MISRGQINDFKGNEEMNGKEISVDEYYGYCEKAPELPIKLGIYVIVSITIEPGCGGDKVIQAKLFLNNAESISIQLTGENQRNCIEGKKGDFDVNILGLITDD